jgi:hypothetical protein
MCTIDQVAQKLNYVVGLKYFELSVESPSLFQTKTIPTTFFFL